MKPARLILAALSCAALPAPLMAQQDKPSIYVSATAPDAVGQRLIYAVREQLGRSATLSLAPAPDSATMELNVVTMDSQQGGYSGNETAYAAVVMIGDRGAFSGASYWKHSVGICGLQRIPACVQTVMTLLDKSAVELQAELRRRQRPKETKP